MGGHAAGDVASKVVIAALEHLDDDAPVRRPAAGAARGRLRRQRAPARGDPRGPAARGHGDDAHRDPVRRRPAGLLPRRRLPRLPAARRRALPDHPRRHVRADADRRRPDHRRRRPTATRSARCCCAPSTARRSSPTSRCARPAPATATCSAPTGSPAWSARRPSPRRCSDPDPQATADRLIELALRGGGPDNITVIVADVVEDDGRGAPDGAGGRRRRRRQRRPAPGRRPLGRRPGRARRPAAPPPPPTAHTADGRWPPPPRRRPLRLRSWWRVARPRRARRGGRRRLDLGAGALVRRRRAAAATASTSRSSAAWTSPSSGFDLLPGRPRHRPRRRRPDPGGTQPGPRAASPPTSPADAARILAALRDQRLPRAAAPPPTARAAPAADAAPAAPDRRAPPGPLHRRRPRPRPRQPAPPDAARRTDHRVDDRAGPGWTAGRRSDGRPADRSPRAPRPRVPTRRGTEALLLGLRRASSPSSPSASSTSRSPTRCARELLDVRRCGSRRCGWWRTSSSASWAPYADPLLLPAVALLVGLGLAMIHRLDLGRRAERRHAGRAPTRRVQLIWATLGVGAVRRRARRRPRPPRRWRATPTPSRWSASACSRCPAVLPASLSEVNGAKIWIRLAGFSIQPGEFAKICLIVFFAAYLVDKRDVLALASRKVAGLELPRGRDLGPVLRGLGAVDPGAGLRARPGQLAAALRHLRGDALRRHRAGQLAGHRRRCCSPPARSSPTRRSATSGTASTSGWTRSAYAQRHRATSSSQSLFGLGTGGHLRRRARRRPPGAGAGGQERLHRRRHRRGARPVRPGRGDRASTWSSSSAGCAPRWSSATPSASCSPPAWPSRWPGRCSSSSAASPACSRSPA